VGTIRSDNDKTRVLSTVAEKYRNNTAIRDGVQKAADKISSDSDYRRIVSKLLADARESTEKEPE
jgi:hypothetical protein